MPGRRIPPQIMAYLGNCREPNGTVEKVVEQCGLGKFMGDEGLTTYDPLVVVMDLVTEEFLGLKKSFKSPITRKNWSEAMRRLQEDISILEQNPFIPCRCCDQAFEPVIDEVLLSLFLAWYKSRRTEDLLAIHRCPACGGQIKAQRTKVYKEDFQHAGTAIDRRR